MPTPQQDDAFDPMLAKIANQLADEGVPVRAIARSINVPFAEVADLLQRSVQTGIILQVPKPDWPPTKDSTRENRTPMFDMFSNYNEDVLHLTLIRLFAVSRLQAAFMAALLRRKEISRRTLHEIIEGRRPPGSTETEEKMVDVVICNLRKRLKKHDLVIKTIWSAGYYMETDQRRRVRDMLNEHSHEVNPTGSPLQSFQIEEEDESDTAVQ